MTRSKLVRRIVTAVVLIALAALVAYLVITTHAQ
jgi:uncharacterized membrane protein YccC